MGRTWNAERDHHQVSDYAARDAGAGDSGPVDDPAFVVVDGKGDARNLSLSLQSMRSIRLRCL
ncbi:MAG: hypothetical protein WCJ64_20880 [Rhodospirillaceae bacterium]